MAAAADLLDARRFGYLKPKDVARLAEAYRFSEAAHAGQTRQSGDPSATRKDMCWTVAADPFQSAFLANCISEAWDWRGAIWDART